MGLAEKFKTLQPSIYGLPCGVDRMLQSMNQEDKDVLNSVLFPEPLLTTPRVSNSKIHQLLTEEGYEISLSTIAHHRRRQCRCFTSVNIKAKESAGV